MGLKDLVDYTTGVKKEIKVNDDAQELTDAIMAHYAQHEPYVKKANGFHASWFATNQGDCFRFWYYAFQGTEALDKHSERLMAIFATGHMFHDHMQAHLEDMGLLGAAEIPVRHDDPPFEGHSDGIINFNDKNSVIELKSTGQEGFFYRIHNGPKDSHVEQTLYYMYCMGVDHGYIIYWNKNDQNIKTFPIAMTDEARKFVEDKFDWMRELYGKLEESKPHRGHRRTSKACKECPFYGPCYEDEDRGIDFELPKYKDVGVLPYFGD